MTPLFAKDAFAGRTVLITGATSGIGEGTARAFAAHGANVMLNGRDEARGGAVLAAIANDGGSAALSLGDVADPAYCDRLVDETVDRFGRLDVLFNNAGVCLHGPIDETSDDDWDRLIGINVSGSFYMARAAVRRMKAQGEGGAIVNMSSECGLIAYERLPAYSATKGAIAMLTKCMAMDHARDGIRVNAVCPGDIDTPMTDQGWAAPQPLVRRDPRAAEGAHPARQGGPAFGYRQRGDVPRLRRRRLRHRHPAPDRRRHDGTVSAPPA